MCMEYLKLPNIYNLNKLNVVKSYIKNADFTKINYNQ